MLWEQRDTRHNVAATNTDQTATITALTLALSQAQERSVSAVSVITEPPAEVTNHTNQALLQRGTLTHTGLG
jgi:hypothetical protein